MTMWPFCAWCPDGVVRLANEQFTDMAGEPPDAVIGLSVTELADRYWVDAADAAGTLTLMRTTAVEKIRVRRDLRRPGLAPTPVEVWVRSIDLGAERWGAAFATPVSEAERPSRDGESVSLALDRLVLGLVDETEMVLAVSRDVDDVLGVGPTDVVGTPLSAWLGGEPLEPAAPVAPGTARDRLLSHASGTPIPASVMSAPREPGSPHRVFALSPAPPAGASARDRTADLEMHMSRIAAEVQAAGLPLGTALTMPDRVSQLASLTDRQWAILSRLMDGMTSSEIAADVFLSPSTVRNHLSAIFRKFGVHNQVQLLRVLGSGER